MPFPPPDIHEFLLANIPGRFRQLSPDEFGAFVGFLFEKDGFAVETGLPSADFGYVVRAGNEDFSLVVLSRQIDPATKVEAEVIRKADQARQLYHTDQAWVIATSDFTEEAHQLAAHLDIEFWDWDELYKAICDLFFEGKTHLEYEHVPLQTEVPESKEEERLKLKVKWNPKAGLETTWYNLELIVSNTTQENLYVHFELPAFIDTAKRQIFADQWAQEEFVSGMIYAGAKIQTNALFSVSKLGDRPPGGHIILTYHIRSTHTLTEHIHARIRGEACYLVTHCFTSRSEEYEIMIWFRDNILRKWALGQWAIGMYYGISPWLIDFTSEYPTADRMVKNLTRFMVNQVSRMYSRRRL